MDIINVFFILAVSVAGTGFLSHAIGYRRGKVAGKRVAREALKRQIIEHQNRIGL